MFFVTRREHERLLRRVSSLERRLARATAEQKKTATVSEMTTANEKKYDIAKAVDEWLNGEGEERNV